MSAFEIKENEREFPENADCNAFLGSDLPHIYVLSLHLLRTVGMRSAQDFNRPVACRMGT
jgi:hypothetical protein